MTISNNTPYMHMPTGKVYFTANTDHLLQVEGKWVPAVEYKNSENQTFIRTAKEFQSKFSEVVDTEHIPSAEDVVATIPKELFDRFDLLGLIPNNVRSSNGGQSNYASKLIQPWTIWLDYPELTPWDHDIIKRTLRIKSTDSRQLDYEKIIHICQERLRQINFKEKHETVS